MRSLKELTEEYMLHEYPNLEQFVDQQSAICNRIDEIFDSESAPSGWEQHWPPAHSRETYKEVEMMVTEEELKLLSDEYINRRTPKIIQPEPEMKKPTFEMKIEYDLLRTYYHDDETKPCIDKKCTRSVSSGDQCFIDTNTNGIYCADCGINERYLRKKASQREGPPRKIIGLDI